MAACAVVAIAATGVGLLRPPANPDAGWLRTVRLTGAAAAVAGLAALLLRRRRLRTDDYRGPDPTGSALFTAAKIMGILALIALLLPTPRVETDAGSAASTGVGGVVTNSEAPLTSAPPPPSSQPPPGEADRPPEEDEELRPADPDMPAAAEADGDDSGVAVTASDEGILGRPGTVVLLLLLLVVAAIAFLAVTGRLRRRSEPPDAPVAAEDAEAAVQASLDEVASDSRDPRGQITAAYRRLLAALIAAGAPRRPHEAPHEHLHRVLGPLGVRPGPMHRLTELYVAARFGDRTITDRHRAAAAEALDAGLDDLRAATGSPDADGAGIVPEEATA